MWWPVLSGGLLMMDWWKPLMMVPVILCLIMAVAVLSWIAGHFVQNIIQTIIQEIRQAF